MFSLADYCSTGIRTIANGQPIGAVCARRQGLIHALLLHYFSHQTTNYDVLYNALDLYYDVVTHYTLLFLGLDRLIDGTHMRLLEAGHSATRQKQWQRQYT